MFWRASKASVTPMAFAVAGMSCIRPRAPAVETARRSNCDSTWMIARMRSWLIPCWTEAAMMWWSKSWLAEGRRLNPGEWMTIPLGLR
jgi:hypothetical protein